MNTIYAYTDGACSGNPGPGGWAVVYPNDGLLPLKYSGSLDTCTNNIAELMAVLQAVLHCDEGFNLVIRSDSTYVVNGITKGPGWVTSASKNSDLWINTFRMAERKIITLSAEWVKGHSGDEYNEMCDRLAKAQVIR